MYDSYALYNDLSGFRKEPLPLSIFFLAAFLAGAVSVAALSGFNYLIIGLGALSAFAFLLASMRDGLFIAPEIKLFIFFFAWVALGFLVVKHPILYFDRVRTLLQFVVMITIVSYYAKNVRCVSVLLMAVFTGILIVVIASVISGEFQRAEVEGEEARLAGIALNANAFAVAITYGMMILLYYFRTVKSLLVKGVIVLLLLAALRFVIASGSRKGFLCAGILLVSWFFFTYRKELIKKPHVALSALLVVCLLGAFAVYQLRDSVMLRRLLTAQATLEGGESEGSTLSRIGMIKEGVYFTLTHPILGLGIDHFRVYSARGLYAHNNYIEVFATTGIPGGLAYFSIYAVIIIRLLKLSKYSLTFKQRALIDVFKSLMVIRLAYDLVVVSYYGKSDWIILAIVIGFTYHLQKELENQQHNMQYDDTILIDDEMSYESRQAH